MTPEQSERVKTAQEREDVIQKALREFNAGEHRSIRAAGIANNAPMSALRNRHKGRPSNLTSYSSMRKLSPEQEKTITEWYKGLQREGVAPTHTMIRGFIQHLHPEPLGHNWVTKFLKRNSLSVVRTNNPVSASVDTDGIGDGDGDADSDAKGEPEDDMDGEDGPEDELHASLPFYDPDERDPWAAAGKIKRILDSAADLARQQVTKEMSQGIQNLGTEAVVQFLIARAAVKEVKLLRKQKKNRKFARSVGPTVNGARKRPRTAVAAAAAATGV